MRSRSSHSKTIHWFLSIALLLTALVSTSTARADVDPGYKVWTTVGSAGTIDEADTGKLVLAGATVAFPEPPITNFPVSASAIGIPTETVAATVRYNVVVTDGTIIGGSFLSMRARFRDDGNNAQVILRLFEINFETGATSLLLTLDSNAFAPQHDYQLQTVSAQTGFNRPDFVNNAYFIEATLVQKRPTITPFGGGRPGLAAIQLYKNVGPIF
jgi:hypothetical protein